MPSVVIVCTDPSISVVSFDASCSFCLVDISLFVVDFGSFPGNDVDTVLEVVV